MGVNAVISIGWISLLVLPLPALSYKDCTGQEFNELKWNATQYSLDSYQSSVDKGNIVTVQQNGLTTLQTSTLNVRVRESNVRKLILSHNRIRRIGRDPFGITGNCLVVVDLSYNELTTIANDAFTNVPFLQKIDLSHNKLSFVNKYAFATENVVDHIDLEHNEFENVDSLEIFKNLTILNLNHNRLVLKFGKFQHFTKLKRLFVAFNNLETIPLGSFSGMVSLEELNIAGNDILSFSTGFFSSNPSLKFLNISYNKLNTNAIFDQKLLYTLAGLETIILNGNNASDFDLERVINILPQLRYMGVGEMNWDCNRLLLLFTSSRKNSVDLMKYSGKVFNEININGIRCEDHRFIEVENTTLHVLLSQKPKSDSFYTRALRDVRFIVLIVVCCVLTSFCFFILQYVLRKLCERLCCKRKRKSNVRVYQVQKDLEANESFAEDY